MVRTLNIRSWSIITLATALAILRIPGSVDGQEVAVRDNYFVEAEVDDATPYVGQQVTYIVKFYVAYPTDQIPSYSAPEFSGFMNRVRPTRQQYSEIVDDRSYTVYQVSTVLYPIMAGDLSIGSGTMTVPEESCIDWPSARNCPGAFLPLTDRGEPAQFDYDTPLIDLAVQPLPAEDPGSFTGAVGSFRIRTSIDTSRVKVGDSVTLTVTVTGEGNLAGLPDLAWPQISDLRSMSGGHEVNSSVAEGILTETKTFRRILIPQRPGSYTIPPVHYSYFDPQLGVYATESTDPIELEVEGTPSGTGVGFAEVDEQRPRRDADGVDVGTVRPVPAALTRGSSPVTFNPLFWWTWSAPLAVLMLLAAPRLVGGRLRIGSREYGDEKQGPARGSGASENDTAAALLHRRLRLILGDPSNTTSGDGLIAVLRSRGVSVETTEELAEAIARIEEMRFGPGGAKEGDELSEAVERLVRKLDAEISG